MQFVHSLSNLFPTDALSEYPVIFVNVVCVSVCVAWCEKLNRVTDTMHALALFTSYAV